MMYGRAQMNMFIDAGTKDMDLSHIHRILDQCKWSVKYSPSFVKQTAKKTKPVLERTVMVGEPMNPADPLYGHLLRVAESPGWHTVDDLGIHVARNAKSFRLPMPRFDPQVFSRRSFFGMFIMPNGAFEWKRLEHFVEYMGLQNRQGLIGGSPDVLVTVFSQGPVQSTINKKTRSAVEDNIDEG
jgi:hypothetical protein